MTTPKARPILQTAHAAFTVLAGVSFLLLGAASQPVYVPPWFLTGVGACVLFMAAASGALAWQHWRLAAALRGLAKAREEAGL